MPGEPLVIRALGLFTHPNRFALPPGALLVAENCVITREGVASRRRGVRRYGASFTSPASALAEFLGRLLLLDGSSLKYDSDGIGTSWTAWTGSFSAPADVRMRFLEAAGNLYFTTDKGVYVNDSLAGTPVRSGTPQGLDMQLTRVGTGGSWLLVDTAAGYRVTWKHTDGNGNSKRGSPSFQERVVNPKTTGLTWNRSGTTVTITHTAHGFSNGDTIEIADSSDVAALPNGTKTISNVTANTYDVTGINAGATSGTCSDGKRFNVQLVFTIPKDIKADDEYEVWRTNLSATAGTPVGDDHRLILSGKVTSGDISAGTITVTDSKDPSFLGEELYTNSSLETLSQANDRPPLAKFIVQFEGHTFYFRAVQPHTLELQLLDIAGLTDDTSSITITSGVSSRTYTFSTAENQGANKFKRFTAEPTLVQNIEKTAKSLVKIINRDSGNTLVTAHYSSGEDDPPGKILIEKQTLGSSLFSVTADTTNTGSKFSPALPTSGTSVKSSDNGKAHGGWRAKSGQPEAVPRLNFHVFGKSNKDILGVVALKEAILVYKEDGIFVLTGQSDGASGANFVVDELDPTVILDGRNTLVLLDNGAISHTSQGVLRAGQGIPSILSRPQIETELRRISKLAAFKSLSHAIAYESEREYLLFTPSDALDTAATMVWVYNYGTTAWTTWRKKIGTGHVLSTDDKLYLCHATEPRILQERKTYLPNGDDFVDEDIDVTITATGTTTHPTLGTTVSQVTITYSYTEELDEGWLLSQGASKDVVDLVEDLGGGSYRLTLRNLVIGFANGAATVSLPVVMKVEWAPITAGDPSTLKQFPFCSVYVEKAGGTHDLAFKSDMQNARESIDTIIIKKSAGWGNGSWGGFPWGDSQEAAVPLLRTWVPIDHQKCRALTVRYENRYARHSVDILCLSLDTRIISKKAERQPA